MRIGILAIAVSMSATLAAQAQQSTTLPEIRVPSPTTTPRQTGPGPGPAVGSGAPATAPRKDIAPDVPPGGVKSFDCLNELMRRKADETNPTTIAPPIDAKSSDLKTGVVNIPGVQQQYGKNFGHSAVPFRPAAAKFQRFVDGPPITELHGGICRRICVALGEQTIGA